MFEAGMFCSEAAIELGFTPLGRIRSSKCRLDDSTGVPGTNGLTLPGSGVILLSLATENGFAELS